MFRYSNLYNNNITIFQNTNENIGYLQINVTSSIDSKPLAGAVIRVYDPNYMDNPIKETTTNNIGRTENIELPAPPADYSSQPSVERPYNNYNVRISLEKFETFEINGINIYPDEISIQNAALFPVEADVESAVSFVIPDNTLYGDYPPKIAETEIKPIEESGEIVLSRVVIPEYIVVHDGPPDDNSAKNYYVKYKDYIKNVASSEIYATWPESTITANVLAIQSFTLNRVYTEWYRNKGYNFTITSSTAFDHKWIPQRNVFKNISRIVDTIFANFLSRPNIKQPILTQYCDGEKVNCPNWMTI